MTLFRLMKTDFRVFLCQQKPLLKSGGIQFLKHIPDGKAYPCQGKPTFRLMKTIYFLHFSETPTGDSFCSFSRKVFSSEIFHSGQWKHCTKNEVFHWKFFSKYEQIRGKLRIQSHVLKKSLMENLIFCVALVLVEKVFSLQWKPSMALAETNFLKKTIL